MRFREEREKQAQIGDFNLLEIDELMVFANENSNGTRVVKEADCRESRTRDNFDFEKTISKGESRLLTQNNRRSGCNYYIKQSLLWPMT